MANVITAIGAKQIGASMGELQRKNHYSLNFVWSKDSKVAAKLGARFKSKNFSWFVQSVPLPKEKTEALEYKHGNSVQKFAGLTTFDDVPLKIFDSIDLDTEKVISIWRESVYDIKGDIVGKKSDYAATLTVDEYSPDGSVTRTFKYFNVWPKEVEYGELDSESNDFKDISVTLAYDYAYRVN